MVPRSRRYIRIIPHERVKDTGSYEVKFPDGRESVYFRFEDNPSRRLGSEQLTRAQAIEKARKLARTEQDKIDRKQ